MARSKSNWNSKPAKDKDGKHRRETKDERRARLRSQQEAREHCLKILPISGGVVLFFLIVFGLYVSSVPPRAPELDVENVTNAQQQQQQQSQQVPNPTIGDPNDVQVHVTAGQDGDFSANAIPTRMDPQQQQQQQHNSPSGGGEATTISVDNGSGGVVEFDTKVLLEEATIALKDTLMRDNPDLSEAEAQEQARGLIQNAQVLNSDLQSGNFLQDAIEQASNLMEDTASSSSSAASKPEALNHRAQQHRPQQPNNDKHGAEAVRFFPGPSSTVQSIKVERTGGSSSIRIERPDAHASTTTTEKYREL